MHILKAAIPHGFLKKAPEKHINFLGLKQYLNILLIIWCCKSFFTLLIEKKVVYSLVFVSRKETIIMVNFQQVNSEQTLNGIKHIIIGTFLQGINEHG